MIVFCSSVGFIAALLQSLAKTCAFRTTQAGFLALSSTKQKEAPVVRKSESLFILDLGQVQLPEGWPATARQLHAKEGSYQSDFDLVDFPVELARFLKSISEPILSHKQRRYPAGFDLSQLPPGAVLKKVR